jgi:hypothetical protein
MPCGGDLRRFSGIFKPYVKIRNALSDSHLRLGYAFFRECAPQNRKIPNDLGRFPRLSQASILNFNKKG